MDLIDNADTESILPSSIRGFTSQDFQNDLQDKLIICPKCLLGVGAYGAVYEATMKVLDRPSPEIVAVKFQALPEEDMLLNNLVAELSLLQGLNHDHLLQFHGSALLMPPPPQPGTYLPFDSTTTSFCVAMVTEVARNGDVESWIVKAARCQQKGNEEKLKDNGFPWALRVRCCAQVASALDFIHCQDVVHRDLKTANILLDANFNAKVCDFGLAIGAESPMKMLFVGGTESYMAPEVLLAEDYGTPADMYSLGLVAASLLSLRPIGEEYCGDVPQPELAVYQEDDEDDEDEGGGGSGGGGDGEVEVVETYDENNSHHHQDSCIEEWMKPLPPILVRHPRSFFEASAEEIRENACEDAPEAFIDLAIQCCSNDPDSRPNAGDAAMLLSEILTNLLDGSSMSFPTPFPPSPLESALPKVKKELNRWSSLKPRVPPRPNRPPPKRPSQLPPKPGRPLPPTPNQNAVQSTADDASDPMRTKPTTTSASFSLPPRPKTPPPSKAPTGRFIPKKAMSMTETTRPDAGTMGVVAPPPGTRTRATAPAAPPDELSVLLRSMNLKVKDKLALEKASKSNPASLVGKWVFISGLGLGQVAEFHRVKSITQRRTHDSYHTVELTSLHPTTSLTNSMAHSDLTTRTGSMLIPSHRAQAAASTTDVLSHETLSFDGLVGRGSMAHLLPNSPTRAPLTKRVRCLLRRRKMGKINSGLKFVLVESELLPDVEGNLGFSPKTSRFHVHGSGGGGGGDSDSDEGGESQNNESEVKKKGWLSLERPGGGMVPRYFTLTDYGLGYSKGPDKPPKNDATHCVLLPHLVITKDLNSARRFRVGRWYLEGLDEADTADWINDLEVTVKKASNHHH